MPIEIGDSTATVRSKINAVLTDAGLNPADNVDTTAATNLLNQVAALWDVDVEFVNRMPEADFRAAFALLEEGITPTGFLGASLIAWWTADDPSTFTLSGSQVTSWRDKVSGYNMVQAVSGARPVYSAAGFNGAPCVTVDGTDDELTLSPLPAAFPSGSAESEIWAITDQAVAAASTGVRMLGSYGGLTNTRRTVGRTVSSGMNRGEVRAGTGSAETAHISTDGDFSGRSVVRARYRGASGTTFQMVGVGAETGNVFSIAGTATDRARIFASPNPTASAFWLGSHRDYLITHPLSTQQVSALTAWALPRRNL